MERAENFVCYVRTFMAWRSKSAVLVSVQALRVLRIS